ncbi:hypothetical protein [Neobacillus bataviensis]|uniref:hypothetical protein n=1 Tax=Neobacillus bataviensis TaxID=220685 RepID=UPI001CBF212E|nr:hypothetical protein [Neobacillus bataviensis]
MAVSYHFTLELMLGMLLVFLYFINKEELPPLFFLFPICLGSLILFIILLHQYQNKGKWIYFLTVFPLLLMAGYQTGQPISLWMFIGVLIFWRGIILYDDFSSRSDVHMLLLSFFIGMAAIIYTAMSHYIYQNQIIILLIVKVFLVLAANFFKKWNAIHGDKTRFALYYIKILAGLSLVGLIFTFLLKYIQKAYFGILQLFIFAFSKIAEPLLNMFQYLFSLYENNEYKPNSKGTKIELDSGKYQEQTFGMTENILYLILILALLGFIIYFIYKKKLKLQTFSGNPSNKVEVSEGVFSGKLTSFLRKKEKPPEDSIRKEIFELEIFAQKLQLGRFPFENLQEWFNRVGIRELNETIEIYEKVRYGGLLSSMDDQNMIKKDIHLIKQKLKEIHKNRKKA